MITIDEAKATGSLSTDQLEIITVKGTATPTETSCHRLTIVLSCDGIKSISRDVTVETDADGDGETDGDGDGGVAWTAEFSAAEYDVNSLGCQCSEGDDFQITVTATCADDASCSAERTLTLECEEPSCPTIVISKLKTSCGSQGKYTVTIWFTITPSSNSAYSAELVDNSTATVDPLDSVTDCFVEATLKVTDEPYSGPVDFECRVTDPKTCELVSKLTVPITPPDCYECPSFSYQPKPVGDCDENGNRDVHIEVELTSSDLYTAKLMKASDGITLDELVDQTGTKKLSYSGKYPSGSTHKFVVKIISPEDCGDYEFFVGVPPCCPKVQFSHDISDDCDENGARSVTITTDINSAGSYHVTLKDPGGNQVGVASGTGHKVLSHTAKYVGGSSIQYTAVIYEPSGCDEVSYTFTVPPCNDSGSDTVSPVSPGGSGGPGGPGGCLPVLCPILLTIWTILFVAFLVMLALAVCVPNPYYLGVVAAVGILALVVMMIWASVCWSTCVAWRALHWVFFVSALIAGYCSLVCPLTIPFAGIYLTVVVVIEFIMSRLRCRLPSNSITPPFV